jgi:hypothetical protein
MCMDYHFTIIPVFHPPKSPVVSSLISVYNMESLIWSHHASRLRRRPLFGSHLDSSCCKSIGRYRQVTSCVAASKVAAFTTPASRQTDRQTS